MIAVNFKEGKFYKDKEIKNKLSQSKPLENGQKKLNILINWFNQLMKNLEIFKLQI